MKAEPFKRMYLSDVSMRGDGGRGCQRLSLNAMRLIVLALDNARVDAIEIAQGTYRDGSPGLAFGDGRSMHTALDGIEAAAEVAKHAEIATLLTPDVRTMDDVRAAHSAGATVVRVAASCMEADVCGPYLEEARRLDMDAVGLLLMSHLASPHRLAEQARRMERCGATCIYVVDSAGALNTAGVRDRVRALKNTLAPYTHVGIHAHNMVGLSVANSVVAVEEGCDRVDAALGIPSADGGCVPLDVLVAVAAQRGWRHGCDLAALSGAAYDLAGVAQEGARQVVMARRTHDDSQAQSTSDWSRA